MSTTDYPPATAFPGLAPIAAHGRHLHWGAVFAGLASAIAVNIVLAEAWMGIGLALVDRNTTAGAVVSSSAVVWAVSACIALFIGGWVAGRLAHDSDATEHGIHGALVWASGAVIGVLFAATAAGVLVNGTASVVGKGLASVGSAVQVAAPGWDAIKSEVQNGLVTKTGDLAVPDDRLSDRSRLMELLGMDFTVDEKRQLTDAERSELVGLIAGQTGVSKEGAGKALLQWERVWKQTLQRYEDAKERARIAADEARVAGAKAACWAVISLITTLAAGIAGGVVGGRNHMHACVRTAPSRVLVG